ncbi:Cwf15/Cwc15 cell cycle control protein [Fistulina hepatica ATCC 64428]|uniref:Cwf15/Cwc15 cell cycle control protein n=1 Tax=Fistulina hepatica ATCC 64428 TaxID=1128425 RepID=A0A0D7AHW4_9AGAR|nr:Cwf15/Cwc15 cell cycle control protein [Fistulina hepatica ATCC 64428]
MSTAHRPTWDPAQARETKGASRQYSSRDMAAHTKLKFRQVGQTSVGEVKKRDLRAELLAAEVEARNKKRKAEGKPPLPVEGAPAADDEANKRRKLLQEAIEMDKDDDEVVDERPNGTTEQNGSDKGKGKEADADDDGDDEDESDEDDTDELLRELEKIKRERAEEKARQEREVSATQAAEREAEIATGNPLLNFAAALGQQKTGLNTAAPGTFAVKRRWDDDLIFKNQAMASRDKPERGFVNDLLRTEFHKKFMAKFIKVCSSSVFLFLSLCR